METNCWVSTRVHRKLYGGDSAKGEQGHHQQKEGTRVKVRSSLKGPKLVPGVKIPNPLGNRRSSSRQESLKTRDP